VHNTDDSWELINQFKYSVQKDRANIHWADVDGDGRVEMIWTDKFNGDGWVWWNNGRKEVSGSEFEWIPPTEPSYMGNRAGTCMYYPDLDGDGRADMHALTGTWTNQAWFNPCAGNAQGDDPGGVIDPKLPSQPQLDTNNLACIAGTGPDQPADFAGLCAFACEYNVCPSPCECVKTGQAKTPPASDGTVGTSQPGTPGATDTLCEFACGRGLCPEDLCVKNSGGGGGSNGRPPQSPYCVDGQPSGGVSAYAWAYVSCEGLTNDNPQDYLDPSDRWAAAKGDDAAGVFLGWYASSRENGDLSAVEQNNIVPAAARYFNITSQADHSELSCFPHDQNCPAIGVCNANAPAGGLIFDSFSSIQTYFATLYDAVNVAGLQFDMKLDHLTQTFVRTHEDDNQVLHIILDVFSLIFGISLSGVYNKVLKNLSFVTGREDNLAWAQASVAQMANSAIAIARDSGQAALIQMNDNAQLGSNLSSIYNQTSGSSATPRSLSSTAMTRRACWVC
jgi:hypothetical protein